MIPPRRRGRRFLPTRSPPRSASTWGTSAPWRPAPPRSTSPRRPRPWSWLPPFLEPFPAVRVGRPTSHARGDRLVPLPLGPVEGAEDEREDWDHQGAAPASHF